jgi:hypothetical protein
MLVSAGCSRRAAAEQLGIAPSTITNATKNDKKFAHELRMAELAGCDRRVRAIVRTGCKGWRAHAYMLERLLPEVYGRR